jgi:hypothetical protein
MTILCPGCGREYALSLFALGRTIDCTCGTRVGLEPPPLPADEAGAPRFVVDAMLGRLARRLRLLGFDAVWDAHIRAEEIARRAWRESRVVLTRSPSLPRRWRLPRVLVLRASDVSEQLRELSRELAIEQHKLPFTRCSRCNEPLEDAPRETLPERVPPRVQREQSRFARCPRCERIYWAGSHVARMRRWMDAIEHQARSVGP